MTNSPTIPETPPSDSPESGDPIERAWEEVDRSWEDEALHARLLEVGRSVGRLGEVGRRYREVRERNPDRAAVAGRQIDRIVGIAMSGLVPSPPDEQRVTRRIVVGVGIVVALVLVMIASKVLLGAR